MILCDFFIDLKDLNSYLIVYSASSLETKLQSLKIGLFRSFYLLVLSPIVQLSLIFTPQILVYEQLELLSQDEI